ncbi:MAG: T9SS type A sorting domain-containing protein [Bacteroidetes bacterium]|nr:T9SS type A sorting domain-containing protein [Bacteroidota bacterium]MBS1973129.1 T9SS type A sorting domain-containing protein [Bacteroidota bacterium]
MVKALLIPKGRAIVLIILLLLINLQSYSQQPGDYVAVGNGNWSNLATWNIWNGSALNPPTPAQGYPGFSSSPSVYIQSPTIVTVDVSPPNPIDSIYFFKTLFQPAPSVTNNNTLTVSGSLYGVGSFTQGSNSTLNIGGSISSTFNATASGNTVNYTAASPSILSTTYQNLTFSGSGSSSIPAAALINGNLTLSGTITVNNANGPLTIGGDLVVNDGNTFKEQGYNFTVNGTTTIGSGTSGVFTTTSAAGTKIFNGLISINAGGTWDNTSACPITVTKGGITNHGTFNAVSTYTFTTNNQDLHGTFGIPDVVVTSINLTNNDTFFITNSVTGTGALVQANNALLNLGCTTTGISSLTATASGNTVNYYTTSQTVFPTNYYNLKLSGGGTDVLQAATNTIAGNFTLTGGSVATSAVTNMAINGNMTLGPGTSFTAGSLSHSIGGNLIDSGTFNAPGSTIVFNGSGAQTIGGPSAITFNNLTINNSGSGVTTVDANNQTKTVTGSLSLSNGKLTTSASNLLLLTSTASASVSGTAPCVVGPMQKTGSTAFVFPVGGANGYVPIGIGATSDASTQTFQAEYVRSSAYTEGAIATGSNLKRISSCDYWKLGPVTSLGAATADITLYWNANNPCGGQYVTDLPTLAIGHFGGVNWDEVAVSPSYTTTGTAASGSITYANNANFSPFALASTSLATNPLPIIFDYFNVNKANGYNQLSWKAECTESSNAFEAQKSYDGISFVSIDTVHVSSAADCGQPFAYNDYDASGHNVIYYRIQATEISGKTYYSQTIPVASDAAVINFISVAPNPVVNDAVIKVSSSHSGRVELFILSLDGKQLQHNTVQVGIGVNTLRFRADQLAKGMYIVKGVFADGQSHTLKFIKE